MIMRDYNMYYFLCCRKKKGFDWKAYVQRQINRFNKELTEDIHKVGVLIYKQSINLFQQGAHR